MTQKERWAQTLYEARCFGLSSPDSLATGPAKCPDEATTDWAADFLSHTSYSFLTFEFKQIRPLKQSETHYNSTDPLAQSITSPSQTAERTVCLW